MNDLFSPVQVVHGCIVSLFDESGNALRPWANAGHTCFAFDIENEPKTERVGNGSITYIRADLSDWSMIWRIVAMKPAFVMGFPPCTDLAVSGARHFAKKLAADPDCQKRAVALARMVEFVGTMTGAPWMAENPRSVLATMWRKPNHSFEPWHYGGVLPENDIHPRWPEYIVPRDAYPKTTFLWTGNGYQLPPRLPVTCPPGWSNQQKKLGGKSKKTKQIRSETPRGFAIMNYLANGLRIAA